MSIESEITRLVNAKQELADWLTEQNFLWKRHWRSTPKHETVLTILLASTGSQSITNI